MPIKQKTRKRDTNNQQEKLSVKSSKSVSIFGLDVKMGSDMMSLTDLWKATGEDLSKRPAEWLRQSETVVFLIACVEKVTGNHLLPRRPFAKRGNTGDIRKWSSLVMSECDNKSLIKKITGRNGGTFAHWQIALAYAKWLSPELHLQVNDIYRRVQQADITVAESIIDRTENIEDLKRIEARARNRQSNVGLNNTIADCGGKAKTCAFVANNNNAAITGKTAKELRKEHNLPDKASTRPFLETDQMIDMAFLERLERKSLEKLRPKGHDAILVVCNCAIETVKDALSKHI